MTGEEQCLMLGISETSARRFDAEGLVHSGGHHADLKETAQVSLRWKARPRLTVTVARRPLPAWAQGLFWPVPAPCQPG